MRATLHDELMRDAGFRTEYDDAAERARERFRKRARRTTKAVFIAAMPLAWLAWGFQVFGLVRVMPKPLTGLIAILASGAAFSDSIIRLGYWLLVKIGLIPPPDAERERRVRAELVSSLAAGQPLESLKLAERPPEPKRRRVARRELLLLPFPAAIAAGFLLPGGWWLLFGAIGVVTFVGYLFANAVDKGLEA